MLTYSTLVYTDFVIIDRRILLTGKTPLVSHCQPLPIAPYPTRSQFVTLFIHHAVIIREPANTTIIHNPHTCAKCQNIYTYIL